MAESQQELLDRLRTLIVDVRSRRQTIELEWLNIHSLWEGKPINQRYTSDTYHYSLPQFRRNIERSVTRAKKIMLPQPVFFEVSPLDEFDANASMRAESNYAYFNYLFKKRIKIGRISGQLVRNLLLYSLCTLKTSAHPYEKQVWPRVRVVDPFSYYIYPETSLDLEDRIVMFEDIMLPLSSYEELVAQGIADEITRSDIMKPDWPYHQQIRLGYRGITEPVNSPPDPNKPQPPQNFLSLTEVWFKAQGAWWRTWIAWNVKGGPRMVRRAKPDPYGIPPYQDAFARPMITETYTNSMGHDLQELQVWLNDATNQMEEARVTAALPPVAVDTAMVGRTETLRYGARKIWDVKPEFVKQIDIKDTSTSSLRVVQLIMGLMNSVSGSSTLAEGQPARNMPRAGFAVNNLLNLSMADTQDIAEIIEQECLSPMLADIHRVTQIFIPPSQLIKIPGTQDMGPRNLTIADLQGDYDFDWVGSIASQSQSQRAGQLMMFAQFLVSIQPMLMAQGMMPNWQDLARLIWRDGIGERGINTILHKMTPEEQAMAERMTQSAPGLGQTGPNLLTQLGGAFG